jgi:uncharacterized membrane protein YphA (DoxX/SURF4 family)
MSIYSPAPGSASNPTWSRFRRTIPWIFQVLGAGLFLNFGFGKVTGSNAAAVDTFTQIGLGDWFRVAIGSLEILGAIGLLIPLFAGLAAVCLAVLTIGATVVTLMLGAGSVTAPLMCFAVVAIVAILRRRSILAPLTLARRRLGNSSRASEAKEPSPGNQLLVEETDREQ